MNTVHVCYIKDIELYQGYRIKDIELYKGAIEQYSLINE